jgi:excinuclease ABC subunit A
VAIVEARCHNLRGLSVDIPAGGLVAVTGVSGSGKSTLVFDVLAPALKAKVERCPTLSNRDSLAASCLGVAPTSRFAVIVHEPFSRVVVATRDTLPTSPSSTPASISGTWDGIRTAFAATDGARSRGLTPRHFSTQVKGGRCEACEGAGRTRVSMDFLPDVWVQCEVCAGRRYGPEALACRVEGRSIADVLEMTVAEAGAFFSANASVAPPLSLLSEVGLGYLRLGQGADTLSGGERQRLALAADLGTTGAGRCLYLFDEPTTGLHAADVARLMQVFDRLAAAGHSLVVVEHNLDVIAAADHVLDLGPEGGAGGGRLVAAGTPAQVAATEESWTGKALARAGVASSRGTPGRPDATGGLA